MNHPCLTFHLAYAAMRRQLDEELGTYHGIDLDDFALLHTLASHGDSAVSLDSIAAELNIARSTLLRRLRPLEKTGLVACDGGIRDRRVALRTPGRSVISTAFDTIVRVCERPSIRAHLAPLA